MFRKKITSLTVACIIGLSALTAQAAEISVGGKNFTEQLLLAEMTYQLLGKEGFGVKKIDGMGTTVLRKAQENGQVDIYWEYTGTSLVTFNKIMEPMDADSTYAKVKELDARKGIVWLNASAANNTYALAVRNSDTKGLNTLSDLAAAYNDGKALKMGVNAEFPKRPDGLPGLQKHYDFKVGRPNLAAMQSGLIYTALKEGQVDVGLVFATDGRIAAFNFRVLKDDKDYFPTYALAPTVRKEVLNANPKLADALNKMAAKLDGATMRRLNGLVAVDKKTVEDVATMFLKEHGLI